MSEMYLEGVQSIISRRWKAPASSSITLTSRAPAAAAARSASKRRGAQAPSLLPTNIRRLAVGMAQPKCFFSSSPSDCDCAFPCAFRSAIRTRSDRSASSSARCSAGLTVLRCLQPPHDRPHSDTDCPGEVRRAGKKGVQHHLLPGIFDVIFLHLEVQGDPNSAAPPQSHGTSLSSILGKYSGLRHRVFALRLSLG